MGKEKIEVGRKKWIEERLYYRWQIIRRDPDYINFCNKHEDAFDKTDDFHVFEEVWPDEYENESSKNDPNLDKLYQELSIKYQYQGLENHHKIAWKEALAIEMKTWKIVAVA